MSFIKKNTGRHSRERSERMERDMETEKRDKGLTVLAPEDVFRFACHRDLECFTRCCRDITIFLTPYDIIRAKRAKNLSLEEFLAAHTRTMISVANRTELRSSTHARQTTWERGCRCSPGFDAFSRKRR